MAVGSNVAGKAVDIFHRKFCLGDGIFFFDEMKFLKLLPASVVVKFLRKKSHKKIYRRQKRTEYFFGKFFF